MYLNYRKNTWYYNSTSDGWSSGPDMIDHRYFHACGNFMMGDQTVLIVAGQDQSVEFLPFNETNWIKGEDPIHLKEN